LWNKPYLCHIDLKVMIGKFFHTPQPKGFYIPPRYYDPNKEAREERERRIKEELGIVDEKVDDGKPYRPNIKGQFRMAQGKSKTSERSRQASNTRLIILIMILALVFYLFFYSDFSF